MRCNSQSLYKCPPKQPIQQYSHDKVYQRFQQIQTQIQMVIPQGQFVHSLSLHEQQTNKATEMSELNATHNKMALKTAVETAFSWNVIVNPIHPGPPFGSNCTRGGGGSHSSNTRLRNFWSFLVPFENSV